jgi:hypothetical protein
MPPWYEKLLADAAKDAQVRGRLVWQDLRRGRSPRRRHWQAWSSDTRLFMVRAGNGCVRWVVAVSPRQASGSVYREAREALKLEVQEVLDDTLGVYLRVPPAKQTYWLAARGYGSLVLGARGEELEWHLRRGEPLLIGEEPRTATTRASVVARAPEPPTPWMPPA